MSNTYYLPDVPEVDVTPELLCRILDELPAHEEGDFALAVATDELKALLEACGHTVTIGYQNWGANANG